MRTEEQKKQDAARRAWRKAFREKYGWNPVTQRQRLEMAERRENEFFLENQELRKKVWDQTWELENLRVFADRNRDPEQALRLQFDRQQELRKRLLDFEGGLETLRDMNASLERKLNYAHAEIVRLRANLGDPREFEDCP